jgi:HSP20 family protein
MVETDEAIIVEVELPGVTCEEVRLEVEGEVLRMTGERRAATAQHGRNYHYLEQHYGRFERQLRLPRRVDREALHAECVNGILRITLPKTRELPPASTPPRKEAP